ncbi:ATP-dependent 6-phosphofructokinase [Vairimorpha necatrix]|uniref:ATP-dependent 6-phosphofructokinase n=1 Tax=Vairimorpha necatrix TaxID=6039 RepID=A0AAX4JFE7_9MICR
MKSYIEEVKLTFDSVSEDVGILYEELGLDVIYDTHCIKIYSSPIAKIISIDGGIHVNTIISNDLDKEIYDSMGNKVIVKYIGSHSKLSVGIITSGGDAPGMNSAIRSIIRTGIKAGGSVYGVYRGFDGLINNYICKLGWDTETHNSSEGGTVLLSFRSKDFFNREGRKKAALNLIIRNINSLIILGGDGSLKGAHVLKQEWRELFKELIDEGKLDILAKKSKKKINDESKNFYKDFYGEPECYKETPKKRVTEKYEKDQKSNESFTNPKNLYKYIYDLVIIGIPASIDNDIPLCDFTLGCDTALNRVVESIDHISSTMKSHQRVFVMEVMGRNCGWLALMSAYSCLADYLLIPENPPYNWKNEVMEHIDYGRKHGKPGMFIIVSEGAVDREGNLIDAADMVKYIKTKDIDVRLLKLGHVQRGGPTSASDRIFGTLAGIKAYEEVEKSFSEENYTSKIIVSSNGEVVAKNLEDVITTNELIKTYQTKFDFDSILTNRGNLFKSALSFYLYILQNKKMSRAMYVEDLNLKVLVNNNEELQNKYNKENSGIKNSTVFNTRIGIMQFGERSSGMNTALNSIVQYCYASNIEPLCILNGLEGFKNDQVIKPELYEFGNDFNNGGSILGLGETGVECDVLQQMKKHELKGLIIIGDTVSLDVLYKIKLERLKFSASENEAVSIILIPASSTNNIPCTDISIGTDTALNTILKVSDCSKLSSLSLKKSVFVLEIAGICGYLTCMGGLAAGAFDCFIPERKYLISHLSETAHRLRRKFKEEKRSGTVIFRNEKTFRSISTESFCKVLETDGMFLFGTDYGVLGRLQSGLNPSPIDRINASLLGFKAVDYCTNNNIGVIGIIGNQVHFTDIADCINEYDEETKRVKNPKWLIHSKVCKSLE